MIDRRSQGILNLHTACLGAEAIALWMVMALGASGMPYFTYYSLLSVWA